MSATKKPKPKWSIEAIEALVARLYECRRQWMASDLKGQPVFVLPSRNAQYRDELERCLFAYFETKYGLKEKFNLIDHKSATKTATVIHFPTPNVTLCLMDV